MSADFNAPVLASVSLLGRNDGVFKTLSGFRKDRHTVPDAVNAATQAFLAKLCETELHTEAENLFQRTRTALGYKRRDLSVDYSPGQATLTARDYTLEIAYSLNETDPSRYLVTRTLHGLSDATVLDSAALDGLLARMFSVIVFTLARGVSVEAVIDAVESLEEETDEASLQVTYPSDCSECVLAVAGVDAQVRCTGASLEMEFPRPGSPRELLESFRAVRQAFALTRNPVLAGLL